MERVGRGERAGPAHEAGADQGEGAEGESGPCPQGEVLTREGVRETVATLPTRAGADQESRQRGEGGYPLPTGARC